MKISTTTQQDFNINKKRLSNYALTGQNNNLKIGFGRKLSGAKDIFVNTVKSIKQPKKDTRDNGCMQIKKNIFGQIIEKKETYPKSKLSINTFLENDGTTRIVQVGKIKITQYFDTKKIKKGSSSIDELYNLKLDSEKKETYRSMQFSDGTVLTIREDKDLNRFIITKDNKVRLGAYITDLTTGEPIVSGDRIYERYYNEADNEYVTENILTGRAVKREKYYDEDMKDLKYIYEISEKTGKMVHLKKYLPNSSTENEYFYDENSGELYKKQIRDLSKNNFNEETFEYNENGEVIAHYLDDEYKDSGETIKRKTIYNPKTNKKICIIENNGDNDKVAKFNKSTGKLDSVEEYHKGNMYGRVYYYDDGITPLFQDEFIEEGGYLRHIYTLDGEVESVEQHDADDETISFAKYFNEKGDPMFYEELREDGSYFARYILPKDKYIK